MIDYLAHKLTDALHWVLIAVIAFFGFIFEHDTEILKGMAMVAGALQVYIQVVRARAAKGDE